MKEAELSQDLPGAELIIQGLADLGEGRSDSVEALLIAIAAPRLEQLGVNIPLAETLALEPEMTLYRTLCSEPGDAYARYNALIRRLVSFAQALEHRQWRRRRAAAER